MSLSYLPCRGEGMEYRRKMVQSTQIRKKSVATNVSAPDCHEELSPTNPKEGKADTNILLVLMNGWELVG
jgi:hypothetical protein